MITVPLYVVVSQLALLLVACYVLASAYRRLGAPAARHEHVDEAATLAGTPLPDLGQVVGADGALAPPPRPPGPGPAAVLLYVLPGCEGCLSALNNLKAVTMAAAHQPPVHVVTVGDDNPLDAYARFGFPVWRATRDLTDLFGLTAYPVFLAVDEEGMISAAGSVQDRDAVAAYLASLTGDAPGGSRQVQSISITAKP